MHPYLIICELCELCEQMPSVYFFRKVSIFLGKVAAKAAKQRSGIPAANAAARLLRPLYCLLAADIICRNLKDLLPRLRIEWLLRALPDFGLSEDERKQSTTKQSIGTILLR